MALTPPFVATSTAPTGQELTGVTRTITRKKTTVELNGTLAANAAFTGPWHDTEQDGTIYVVLSLVSNVAAASFGYTLQESDDIGNSNYTRNVNINNHTGGTAVHRLAGPIKARWWRVFYTNGAVGTATIQITAAATNFWQIPDSIPTPGGGSDSAAAEVVSITTVSGAVNISDNVTTINYIAGSNLPSPITLMQYGGRFSGTGSATLQGWSQARTPTVYKNASATASGSTAVWTPAANNKFRLLAYRIQLPASTIAAVAADLTIKLLDSATDIAQNLIVSIPTAVATAIGSSYDSGWVQLGTFGILSAAANNVLNVSLSFALTAGGANVLVAGVEE